MTGKRRIRIEWTCSDFATHHRHRWYWSAWLCGRMQWLRTLPVFVLFLVPALSWAQKPTVVISGDGSATVVSVGTQGPAGASIPVGVATNVFDARGYGAKGDDATDDTASIQAALTALPDYGILFFSPGKYRISSGLTITNKRGVLISGYGAFLVVTADVIPVTITGASATGWTWQGLGLMPFVSTTGPALKITGAAGRFHMLDLRIDYHSGGHTFGHGVLVDQSILGVFTHPVIGAFAVNASTGIDIELKDITGGTYPGVHVITGMDLGGGKTGIKIDHLQGVQLVGGTIENDSYTKAIWITGGSLRTRVEGIHIEAVNPGNAIEVDGASANTVIDSVTVNRPIKLTGALKTSLYNIASLELIADATTYDTAIFGGSIGNIASELGIRTALLGVAQGNDGNPFVIRNGAVRTFGFVAGGNFEAGPVGSAGQLDGGNSAWRFLSAVRINSNSFKTALAALGHSGGGTRTIDANVGNTIVITPTDGTAFTIGNPSGSIGGAGQHLTITVKNTFGTLGVITMGAGYKLSGGQTFPVVANGYSQSIDFIYNGTNWIEASRTSADVPN